MSTVCKRTSESQYVPIDSFDEVGRAFGLIEPVSARRTLVMPFLARYVAVRVDLKRTFVVRLRCLVSMVNTSCDHLRPARAAFLTTLTAALQGGR